MLIVLISIILPVPAKSKTFHAAIDTLIALKGDLEIVVVGELDQSLEVTQPLVHFLPIPPEDYLTRLPEVVATTRGEVVLLFLEDDLQLPPEALVAIERNLSLLPQTIGGNFHLKFKPPSLRIANPLRAIV